MWYPRLYTLPVRISRFSREIRLQNVIVMLCLVLLASVLASCGAAATLQTKPVTQAPTATPSPIVLQTPAATPTPKPPTPTPTLAPQPTVAPQPTQPAPVATPAILDLRPSSMSIVGHLDCQKQAAYVCLARVLSRASNTSDLHWVDFTNVPGGIVFSPASGVLAPGQSVLVTITVPFTACTQGLFFFRGPINTHTITWAC